MPRFFNRLRNSVAEFIKVREQEKGLSADSIASFFNTGIVDHPITLEDYHKHYKHDNSVHVGIDTLAEMEAGAGHYCTMDKEPKTGLNPVEECNELAERIRLDEVLLEIAKTRRVFGFCPVEPVIRRGPPKGIVALRILDPRTVKYIRPKNIVTGYVQTVGTQTVNFKARELSWWTHGMVGTGLGALYGHSKMEHIMKLLDIRDTVIDNINGIMSNQARPPIIWKTNNKQDKETLQATLKERDPEIDLVIYPKNSVEATVLKPNMRASHWEFVEYIDTLIFEGMHAPLLNYLRNATEASAKTMMEAIQLSNEGEQRYSKRMVEHEIYKRHLTLLNWKGEIPTFHWGQPKTGVEDLNASDFLTKGLEVGYIMKNQYLHILRNVLGIDIPDPEADADQPPMPSFTKPDDKDKNPDANPDLNPDGSPRDKEVEP